MSDQTSLIRQESHAAEETQSRGTVSPAVDIYENAEGYLLLADVPGVDKKDVQIRLDKDTLILEAKSVPAESEGLLAAEYELLDYARRFRVPETIDGENITANLDSGVLRVHLPKAASAKPREIPIRTE